jgi:hypothetical protein
MPPATRIGLTTIHDLSYSAVTDEHYAPLSARHHYNTTTLCWISQISLADVG